MINEDLKIVKLDYTKLVTDDTILEVLDKHLESLGLLEFINTYDGRKNPKLYANIAKWEKLSNDEDHCIKCNVLLYSYSTIIFEVSNEIYTILFKRIYNNLSTIPITSYMYRHNILQVDTKPENAIHINSYDFKYRDDFTFSYFYPVEVANIQYLLDNANIKFYTLIPLYYRSIILSIIHKVLKTILYTYIIYSPKGAFPYIIDKYYTISLNISHKYYDTFFSNSTQAINYEDWIEEVKYYYNSKQLDKEVEFKHTDVRNLFIYFDKY